MVNWFSSTIGRGSGTEQWPNSHKDTDTWSNAHQCPMGEKRDVFQRSIRPEQMTTFECPRDREVVKLRSRKEIGRDWRTMRKK